MSENPPKNNGKGKSDEAVVDFPMPHDNIVQSFQLESSAIRGNILRLGSVLDEILEPHNYPAPIDKLTAETVILSLLLSSILKYDGIFTLQIQGDGAISMIVADVDAKGRVRACASYNQEKLDKVKSTEEASLEELLGKAYLAFTVDPGKGMDRYQGIVAVEADTLEKSVQHYFTQSEQLETVIKLAIRKTSKGWRGGSIMIQRMPPDSKVIQEEIKDLVEENWSRASILLDTVTDKELLDSKLHENTLLMRLFHEEGVRVYIPEEIRHTCRCSEDKLKQVLITLPEEDIEHITVNGKIEVKCEFCSRIYLLDPPQ